MTEHPLWQPSADQIARANLTRFARFAGLDNQDYWALHRWSVREPAAFWSALWEFCGVVGERGARDGIALDTMPGAQFFPDAQLNFAENFLAKLPEGPALIFEGEDGTSRTLTGPQIREAVTRTANGLAKLGVQSGDRVAACLPSIPEAVIAMLATASLGAVWSSCSPDFGDGAMLDRFGQIEPKVLFAADRYAYAGKDIALKDKIDLLVSQMPSVETVIEISYDTGAFSPALPFDDDTPLVFERFGFSHPLYILYSSGTTGQPKCIMHGAGGTLLQHLKEHQLHCDIRPGDRVYYFTTLGWTMWNWLVSALASGAAVVLYDGSPFHPGPERQFALAEKTGTTLFGTSAKFIDALAKSGHRPRDHFDLSAMRALCSTGSPLVPEGFDFVYDAIKPDVHLASISGGTDIVSAFVCGVPTLPVWRGEIQAPGLGMDVQVFDDDAKPVREQKGELVCTTAFVCMPVGFWNDPDDAKYRAAYFETYDNVWHHGDFAEITSHGGMIIYGRSDATLNPGGVRIGTSEIYRQVEKIDAILESVCVGQEQDGDMKVLLFVVLRPGATLSDALLADIRTKIRTGASPRHVPARIIAVPDIPRTKSGKITELAIRDVLHGRTIKNTGALANPEALDHFRALAEV